MRFILAIIIMLVAGPAPVRAEWLEASSEHFVIYADMGEARLRRFADKLERFDSAIRFLRNIPDEPVSPSNRVTVYAVAPSSVGRLAGNENIAGFYVGRAGSSVAFVPRAGGSQDESALALTTLFHEYTHHIVANHYSGFAFPFWVNEGLAEFHSTALFRDDGSVTFGAALNQRAYGILYGERVDAARILSNTLPESSAGMDALYGRSWLLIHMLTFSEPRRDQLGRYLGAINEGRSIADAAEVFGETRALDRDIAAYLRQRRILSVTVPGDRLNIGPIRIRPLGRGGSAVMQARLQSTRGVNRETAPRVYNMARRAAAPYPNDAFAQRVLAEAAYDAGDFAEAAAAADRAIAADPAMMEALLYRGMTAMAVAEAQEGGASDATWAAVRRWFTAANRVENDAPLPLLYFHATYAAQGREPTANARDALARAQELAPHDPGLRFSAAIMRLEAGAAAEARRLLRPVAYAPHRGGAAEAAARAITALDASGPEGALAALRAEPAAAETTSAEESERRFSVRW